VRGGVGSSWLAPMAAFFAGSVLVSALGGPLLLGLLVGGAAAFAYRPVRRDPPWTARGRAAWAARGAAALAAARLWTHLLRSLRRGPAEPWVEAAPDPRTASVDALHLREAARFDAAFPVRCEVVTARLQVWHATDTGRAYEVALRDAPVDARPGDEGWLSFRGGRPLVRLGATVERLLN
jgi:hypothetical protein